MTETKTSRRAALEDLHLHFSKSDTQRDPGDQKPGALDPTKGVHAGLWLDKYITNAEAKKVDSQEKTTSRRDLVCDVARLTIPGIYASFYKRWQQMLADMRARTREFTVKGRMAVGLGNEGVLETSVALHRTYGVPYIPGSALKGLAASYARLIAGEGWQQGGEAYKVVFGDTQSAGYVTFFDALYIPAEKREVSPTKSGDGPDCPLHADIITVHHPEYYKGKNAQGRIVSTPIAK